MKATSKSLPEDQDGDQEPNPKQADARSQANARP
jgi:hypothetical protein